MAAEDEPLWVTLDDVDRYHSVAIAKWGGVDGYRDKGLVESACQNPRNLFYYEHADDLIVLAVRLGIAIARNHGFIDGNKRTGALALIYFLAINGYDLIMPDDTSLGRLIEAVIEDAMTEGEMAEHLDHYVFDRD